MKLWLTGLWASRSHGIGLSEGRLCLKKKNPTSASKISSAQMFADSEQLAVLLAFCPLVDHKQVTETGLLKFHLSSVFRKLANICSGAMDSEC